MVFLSGFDIASSVLLAGGSSISRLTARGPRARDCGADPQVCRARRDRLGKVGGHAGRDPGRVGHDRLQARAADREPFEGRGGRLAERRDRHDAAHAQRRAGRRVHRELLEGFGRDAPATGVVGQIDLQQHVEARHPFSRRVERVGQTRAIHGVDDGCRGADRPRLVGLRLPDEVPAQAVASAELALLLGELLLTVLAHVAHAEPVQLVDERRGVELRHDDARQRTRIAARRMCGVRDPGVDLREPFAEAHRYFRKSGMSRSSSPNAESYVVSAATLTETGSLSRSFATSSAGVVGTAGAIGATRALVIGSMRVCGSPPSKPAAMTVTRTSSPSVSSMTVPKMMLASGCAASLTSCAASLISKMPRFDPPWIDSSTPCAPSIDASSSGDSTASSAALMARSAPRAEPMPMSAEPAPCITDFTSAKSRLMRPGVVMRSVMPCTPARSTWSAVANASIIEMPRSLISSRRSFGTTMRVSTSSFSLPTPVSACCWRRRPSNENGLVTTPMVRAPIDLAILATTGAPPVPVPPPSPAVTKTMSAPRSASSISSA